MKLTLDVWRQPDATSPGAFEPYVVTDAPAEMTLLELLDRRGATRRLPDDAREVVRPPG